MIAETSVVDYASVQTLYAHWLNPVSIIVAPFVSPFMAGHQFTKDELYVEAVFENGEMKEITDYMLEQTGVDDTTQSLTLTYGPVSTNVEVEMIPEPDFILPDDLTAIEEEAFMGIDATVILVPENCTSIAARAFADCQKLKYVVVSDLEAIDIAEDALDGTNAVFVEK